MRNTDGKRAVYCLQLDDICDATLEIKSLDSIEIFKGDEQLSLDETVEFISKKYPDIDDSCDEAPCEWMTFDESDLWDSVEYLLTQYRNVRIKTIVDRFVRFKQDGFFD